MAGRAVIDPSPLGLSTPVAASSSIPAPRSVGLEELVLRVLLALGVLLAAVCLFLLAQRRRREERQHVLVEAGASFSSWSGSLRRNEASRVCCCDGVETMICGPPGLQLTEQQEAQVRKTWDRADANGDGKLSREEFMTVIAELPQLWAMLEVNTGIEAQKCQDIATTVAMSKLDRNKDGVLSWGEFRALWTGVLLNPKNQLEFFHRAIFNAFDADGDQYMDREELSQFLEMFYREGGPYKGDARLPPKEELIERAMDRLDKNHDQRLSFRELQPLITGNIDLV